MDLLLLDYDNYKPVHIFEDYTSLIWTERFTSPGEFKLTSSRIEETLRAIPLGSLLTLRDTAEVMMVETYSVGPNSSDRTPELTITGRSLDSFLEHRALLPVNYNESWTTLQSYTAQQMVGLLLWNSFVNGSGEDPTRPTSALKLDPYLVVPNLVVSLSTPMQNSGYQKWVLSPGQVSDVVSNIQKSNQVGIRTIRPVIDSEDLYVKLDADVTNSGSRGVLNLTTMLDDQTKVRFDVYLGTDRTVNQLQVPPVVFRYDLNDILDPSYLRSIKNYKQYAAVSSQSARSNTPTVDDGPDRSLIPTWRPDAYYPQGSIVIHNNEVYMADTEPSFGQEPGIDPPDIYQTYEEFITSDEFDAPPEVFYPFDTPPEPGQNVIDISGNHFNGTWFTTDEENIIQHEPIFGNGSGSLETINTWLTIDGALANHDSWTISCLAKDIDVNGRGWLGGGFTPNPIAARPYSPYSYPWWQMQVKDGRLQGEYTTAWANRMHSVANTMFTPNSEHVLTVRYDATTFTMSTFTDGTKVSETVLPTHPTASTPEQKLQLATSTLYLATSNWGYWKEALDSYKISAMHEAAMNGGVTTPGVPNSWSPMADSMAQSSDSNPYVGSFNYNKVGLNRRVLFVDGRDLTGDDITTLVQTELALHPIFTMADGEISPASSYLYGRDYFLGDLVTFSSIYQPNGSMFINEIIRTEDINGETISPGIIAITSDNAAIYNV